MDASLKQRHDVGASELLAAAAAARPDSGHLPEPAAEFLIGPAQRCPDLGARVKVA